MQGRLPPQAGFERQPRSAVLRNEVSLAQFSLSEKLVRFLERHRSVNLFAAANPYCYVFRTHRHLVPLGPLVEIVNNRSDPYCVGRPANGARGFLCRGQDSDPEAREVHVECLAYASGWCEQGGLRRRQSGRRKRGAQ